MKKEDAIKYLQQLYPNGGHCWLDEQRMEAIGMAVKALQEEPMPKFKAGDHIRPIDSSLGAPRTILEVCDGWYVTNQGTLDFEYEDNWEAVEEPVWIKELQDKLDSLSKEDFDKIWAKYDKYDKVEKPVTSVWHEPSEIPEEKKWMLLAHKEGWYHVGRLYEGQRRNLVISDGVSTFELNMFNKWVYVDDILKF